MKHLGDIHRDFWDTIYHTYTHGLLKISGKTDKDCNIQAPRPSSATSRTASSVCLSHGASLRVSTPASVDASSRTFPCPPYVFLLRPSLVLEVKDHNATGDRTCDSYHGTMNTDKA